MMASSTPSIAQRSAKSSATLLDKLASVLPRSYRFTIYHVSTPPTWTTPLCSAPPRERPDKTYCERHFLIVCIDAPADHAGSKRASPGADEAKEPERSQPVPVLGVELYIFTTAYLSTIFVSKADSTGFLHLLDLPPGTPSPIRQVTSALIEHVVETRRRKKIQSVVSLFARAQAQYLFPLSVENKTKHVLSDQGLVRWWCRVLDPLLREHDDPFPPEQRWGRRKGYLIVPGLEDTEMRAFLPKAPSSSKKWLIGHPLEDMSHYTREFDWVPLRCLIPSFPDDPKSRFRHELEEESSSWKQDMGAWKSVKTLDQFWEMMSHRQECSSGRLTGFIWVVLDPEESLECSQANEIQNRQPATPSVSFSGSKPSAPRATRPRRQANVTVPTPQTSPLKMATHADAASATPSKTRTAGRKKRKLTGPIKARPPHVKTRQRNYLLDRPTSTAYYSWPSEGRGEKIVGEHDFKRIVELLLHLDFSSLDKAIASTRRWIGDVNMGSRWGQQVTGKGSLLLATSDVAATAGQPTNISGLVRKKPKPSRDSGQGTASELAASQVNELAPEQVRKRKKDGDQDEKQA